VRTHRRPGISFSEWCWSRTQKFSLPDRRSYSFIGRSVGSAAGHLARMGPVAVVANGRVVNIGWHQVSRCRYLRFPCVGDGPRKGGGVRVVLS
jgi:hypothetical protein